jgi:cytochrome P450
MSSFLTARQFGMGPRICQGQLIALMEMAKVIPQLIRRFDFEIGSDWKTFNHWLVGYQGIKGPVRLREKHV